MIPIADNIPSRKTPIINYLLIGFNIGLFLWSLKLEVAGELSSFVSRWGLVPARINSIIADVFFSKNPAAWVALILSCSSLLVGIFIHGSFGQILGNMLFLFVFGKNVENNLGHGQYLIFYLTSGIIIAIAQVVVEPTLTIPLVGANGAIATVLGAYFITFPKARIETILPLVIVFIPTELPAIFYLFWWFIQQVFYGFGQLEIAGGVNPVGIAYWTHGIGLGIGAIWMYLIKMQREKIKQ